MDKRRMAALRERFGCTQAELAESLGVASRKTISHWESGVRAPSGPIKRFFVLLEKLSDADFKKVAALLRKIGEERESSK